MPNGFDAAVQFVLGKEGGLNTTAGDSGGQTNFGISHAAFPNVDIANLTREGAIDLYKQYYWNPLGLDKLDPRMQVQVFDTGVNMGIAKAQELLKQSGNNPMKFEQLREDAYRAIVAANPAKGKFLNGWLARARSAVNMKGSEPNESEMYAGLPKNTNLGDDSHDMYPLTVGPGLQ